MSAAYVWQVLRHHRIQLQRRRSWCVSTDPAFAPKAADIVGLYLDPPEQAMVLCVDEKPAIQALERAQGWLRLPNGKAPSIHLDWSDAPGVSRYDLYRNGFFYTNTSTDSYFLNNANVSFGNTYSYYVRAVGSNGLVSAPSNTQSIQATCQVTVGGTDGIGLRLRTCASTNDAVCPVITVLPDGTVMTIFAGPVAADGFNWYAIQGAAGTGWSAGN